MGEEDFTEGNEGKEEDDLPGEEDFTGGNGDNGGEAAPGEWDFTEGNEGNEEEVPIVHGLYIYLSSLPRRSPAKAG
jgi:hypothetical protein